MKKLAYLAAAGAVVLASPAMAATGLIVNGDFETGSFSSFSVNAGSDTGNPPLVIRYSQTGGSNTGASGVFGEAVTPDTITPGGQYAAYFYSDSATQLISQAVGLTANTTYRISFDYYLPLNGIQNASDARLFATYQVGNGAAQQFFSQQGGTTAVPAARTWYTASGTFTTGANQSGNVTLALNFQGLGANGSTAADFVVDNVSLTAAAVPEPSTWAMMLLGFGAVGFVSRRRGKLAGRVVTA